MEEFTIETAQNLLTEFWTEIHSASEENRLTSSIITSKARDYNRKWNKLAVAHPDMKPDGLKDLIKKQLSETPYIRHMYPEALKYL